jgi:hypothetical protein
MVNKWKKNIKFKNLENFKNGKVKQAILLSIKKCILWMLTNDENPVKKFKMQFLMLSSFLGLNF